MNFDNIPLRVPNVEKVKKQFEIFINDFKNAKTCLEALQILKKVFKYEDNLVTELTVISIRFSVNTLDKKIANANNKADEISPIISDICNDFNLELLIVT